MRPLFIAILLLGVFKTATAQTGYFEHKSIKDPSAFLSANVRPIPILMEKCLMPFTYVKFKVTKDNTVDSLIITNNSIEDLTKEITLVMSRTAGHWNVAQTQNHWLIIPLIFFTDFGKNPKGKGCDFKTLLADQSREMEYPNNEPNAIYFPIAKINSGWQ